MAVTFPVAQSQARTVPSALAAATRPPLGLKRIWVIAAGMSRATKTALPAAISQTVNTARYPSLVLVRSAVAVNRPSGLNATSDTGPDGVVSSGEAGFPPATSEE